MGLREGYRYEATEKVIFISTFVIYVIYSATN